MDNFKYKKPTWAVKQITRENGVVEDICKHGIGHPNLDWLNIYDKNGKHCYGIHGCDGCCNENTHRKTSTKRIR